MRYFCILAGNLKNDYVIVVEVSKNFVIKVILVVIAIVVVVVNSKEMEVIMVVLIKERIKVH